MPKKRVTATYKFTLQSQITGFKLTVTTLPISIDAVELEHLSHPAARQLWKNTFQVDVIKGSGGAQVREGEPGLNPLTGTKNVGVEGEVPASASTLILPTVGPWARRLTPLFYWEFIEQIRKKYEIILYSFGCFSLKSHCLKNVGFKKGRFFWN